MVVVYYVAKTINRMLTNTLYVGNKTWDWKDDNGEIQDGIIFDVYFTYDPLSPQERNAIRSMTDEEKNNMIDLRNL